MNPFNNSMEEMYTVLRGVFVEGRKFFRNTYLVLKNLRDVVTYLYALQMARETLKGVNVRFL